MVCSHRAGTPVVDLYREGQEKETCFIGLWLDKGLLVKTEKHLKPVQVMVGATGILPAVVLCKRIATTKTPEKKVK